MSTHQTTSPIDPEPQRMTLPMQYTHALCKSLNRKVYQANTYPARCTTSQHHNVSTQVDTITLNISVPRINTPMISVRTQIGPESLFRAFRTHLPDHQIETGYREPEFNIVELAEHRGLVPRVLSSMYVSQDRRSHLEHGDVSTEVDKRYHTRRTRLFCLEPTN